MRSITLCPVCQTQYFVSQEQLAKQQGQVHVFDANVNKLDSLTETTSGAGDSSLASGHAAIEPVVSNSKLDLTQDNTPHIAARLSFRKPRPSALYAILLLACLFVQCVFFLRNQLVIYYPSSKPYLEQICKTLSCRIALPKKIELIIIDDSDIKEDPVYAGLMHVSSTIINQANFQQAYPNIELTLTDVEDKPKLRRLFKPIEYLASHTNITNGMASGAEVKVHIPIMTPGFIVAGYRVFLTY